MAALSSCGLRRFQVNRQGDRSRTNTHPLSSIPHADIPSAANGSSDHGAFHTPDKLDIGSTPYLGGHNFPIPQMSCRNCREPGTCAAVFCPCLWKSLWNDFVTSRFLYCRHRTPLASIRLENLLPQA